LFRIERGAPRFRPPIAAAGRDDAGA